MDRCRRLGLFRVPHPWLWVVPILSLPFILGATRGPVPVEFMPDILSAGIRPHSRLEFSPDGHKMYWSGYIIGEGNTEWMFSSTWQDGWWTSPVKLQVNDGLGNGPALSPDGDRLFFGAQRHLEPRQRTA